MTDDNWSYQNRGNLMAKAGKEKKKKKGKKSRNLLTLVPIKNCKWTRQKDNPELVKLYKPKFDTKFGKKIGKKLKIKPEYTINLDEYGTAVWRLCNGKITFKEIADILKTQFGDDVEPLYERLAAFFKILESNELIIFKSEDEKKK
jgi:hypothetical protein